ncbi:MAG: ATP-dependent DNA ligase [Gemmatimonadota bacterium]
MTLALEYPYPPMEAKTAEEIPEGDEWGYEPKWDGFRCVAFRDGKTVHLQSKAGKPLDRYFPDIVEAIESIPAKSFVLDGEIVIPIGNRFSFDDLLLRIHPAASRVRTLVEAHPANFIVFDLLADGPGEKGLLVNLSLKERRPRLEQFFRANVSNPTYRLSDFTESISTARKWLREAGGNRDGVVAKRLDLEYRSGDRTGMLKIKRLRTAECVVGGFRYASRGKVVGSLLLGLYDEAGILHHVGFTSAMDAAERKALTPQLEELRQPPGFTGRAPGGPSRWSTERTGEWEPLAPKMVVEVQYDNFTGGRFRHGTRLLRFRPDKPARKCTMDQVTG